MRKGITRTVNAAIAFCLLFAGMALADGYERIQSATSVQVDVLYQIEGRVDTIKLIASGNTQHFNKSGRMVTGSGRDKDALEAAALAGTLWECRELP